MVSCYGACVVNKDKPNGTTEPEIGSHKCETISRNRLKMVTNDDILAMTYIVYFHCLELIQINVRIVHCQGSCAVFLDMPNRTTEPQIGWHRSKTISLAYIVKTWRHCWLFFDDLGDCPTFVQPHWMWNDNILIALENCKSWKTAQDKDHNNKPFPHVVAFLGSISTKYSKTNRHFGHFQPILVEWLLHFCVKRLAVQWHN